MSNPTGHELFFSFITQILAGPGHFVHVGGIGVGLEEVVRVLGSDVEVTASAHLHRVPLPGLLLFR